MSQFQVRKAKRTQRPLKISLEGLSGSGKTYTALRLAFAMRRAGIGKRIVVADSENESASLYEGITEDGERWDYEVCSIPAESQTPNGYASCYDYLVGQGYDIIIIDSMTHAWKGALARVDTLAAASRSNDKFSIGWKAVSPEQEKMMQTITNPKAHVITTTRVKGEFDRVTGGNGKDQWKKIGTKADQREGMEYEYDAVIRIDNEEHLAVVEKVRGCIAMDGKSCKRPGPEFFKPLFDWWLSAPETEKIVPPTVDETIATINAKLNTATTLPELGAAWQSVQADIARLGERKDELVKFKDAKKAQLSAA